MLMRKENSQGCTAAPRKLDWTAAKAQSLVLTSWLLCLSYTWNTTEAAVSHSVNGAQQMLNHSEDWILWSPASSDHKLITNIKENRFQFMKIWKLHNFSYQKCTYLGKQVRRALKPLLLPTLTVAHTATHQSLEYSFASSESPLK